MIFSYNWLKEYFDQDLPSPQDLVDLLTIHSFEIEGLQEKDNNSLIDIDVLPNRAHDALCHYGMAKEVSTITALELKEIKFKKIDNEKTNQTKIEIKDDFCHRYIGKEIRGIKVTQSPIEIKEKLESIGQRPINNIVDITNLVMFELNQPMHAFDTDKLSGDINVRFAKKGEKITTLDNKEIDLSEDIPLIVDQKDPLAIAGVKGGNKAEVNEKTTNIILEAANFDPVLTRKTSQKIGIKTDSSKRFENGITPELAEKAINRATELILKYAKTDQTEILQSIDLYPNPVEKKEIKLSIKKTNSLLGTELAVEEISKILNQLKFNNKILGQEINVEIPSERLDLNIEVDLIEEIGRIYGYNNIANQQIENFDFQPQINKEYAVNLLIRKLLITNKFSEVITYSFVEKGDLMPQKPIAEDKKYLRATLKEGIEKALELNEKNADWLGLDQIKIFEIGKVFSGKPNDYSEKSVLGIGIINKHGIKKPKSGIVLKETIDLLSQEIGIKIDLKIKEDDCFIEIDLEKIYEEIKKKFEYSDFDSPQNETYTSTSAYPFVLRDVAVWLPNNVNSDELVKLIKSEAGNLLVKDPRQFDTYQKNDRTSFAYRLVFQSTEKTLTDQEVNEIMNRISKNIEEKGWEIR